MVIEPRGRTATRSRCKPTCGACASGAGGFQFALLGCPKLRSFFPFLFGFGRSDGFAVAHISHGAPAFQRPPFVVFQRRNENLTAQLALGFLVPAGRDVVRVRASAAFAAERRGRVPPVREVCPFPPWVARVPVRPKQDFNDYFVVGFRDANFLYHHNSPHHLLNKGVGSLSW